MIDYIKIQVLGVNTENLRNLPYLEFNTSVSEKTGILDTKSICDYHKCRVTIYDSGTVKFSGSIHKFYNSITGVEAPNGDVRGYNGNQFSYYEIDFVRQHLTNLFEVPPEQMKIQNIEFGVNLSTSFNPQTFITGLLLFEMKPFEFRFNQYYAQSVHNQYLIKIYNKGHQYDMAIHTMRFEIKILKMVKQINDVGINCFSDVTPDTLKRANDYLIKLLKKTLYFDNTIDKNGLNRHQRSKLKEYSNVRFWQNLTRQQRNKDKRKLNNLIEKHSLNLRGELSKILNLNRLQFDRLFETPKRLQFDHSSIVSDCNLSTTTKHYKKCPVTGVDISMQKEGSKLLSNTGLKYLEKKDRNKFEGLKSILLTGKPNQYEINVYYRMSKQIRNRYFNKPPLESQTVLFDC